MRNTIFIDQRPAARAIVGDVVRFEACDTRGPLFVDIDLVAWTVLRDRNPNCQDATKAVEALTANGIWRTVDGARNVVVSLGPLIIEGANA